MIFRCHITPDVKDRLATAEYDNLPDGSQEVETPRKQLARLHPSTHRSS
jgi:hypothetical protein